MPNEEPQAPALIQEMNRVTQMVHAAATKGAPDDFKRAIEMRTAITAASTALASGDKAKISAALDKLKTYQDAPEPVASTVNPA
jgi:hypothetical protein